MCACTRVRLDANEIPSVVQANSPTVYRDGVTHRGIWSGAPCTARCVVVASHIAQHACRNNAAHGYLRERLRCHRALWHLQPTRADLDWASSRRGSGGVRVASKGIPVKALSKAVAIMKQASMEYAPVVFRQECLILCRLQPIGNVL